METIKVSEIVFREDLYPRFEPNQSIIQKYANSLEYLPPIKINQNRILIDGFHRWKAHQLNGEPEIKVELIKTKSEAELEKLAYQLNSIHGLQLTNDEKQRFAQKMIGEQMTVQDLAVVLSVDESTIKRWTESQRKSLEEDRKRIIIETYLRAWNTQQSIAEVFDSSVGNINAIIEKFKIVHLHEIEKTFKPYLYNLWNTQKQDVQTDSHFGAFPKVFMDNLLYYHTEPLDVVFDPFTGAGTTIDSCKAMFRRYYCTDLEVKPGREKDIIQHDITTGLPEGLPKPKLVFLDPPYWKQAEGKYTDQQTDFSNMTLDEFNAQMEKLLKALTDRKVERIALVIQPTQYKNDWQWVDHAIDAHQMISKKYCIEMRYILPYSTQQYNAQMVEKAKEAKKCLGLWRDLIVWRLK